MEATCSVELKNQEPCILLSDSSIEKVAVHLMVVIYIFFIVFTYLIPFSPYCKFWVGEHKDHFFFTSFFLFSGI